MPTASLFYVIGRIREALVDQIQSGIFQKYEV